MKDKRGTKPKKAKQPITSQKCLYKNIRQWAYYPEFRIAPGAELEEIMERMQLQQQLTPKEDVSQLSEDIIQRMDEQRMETGKIVRLLADVGTGLWRLRKKMVHEKTEEPLDEMRKAYRHLESIWDALKNAEIVIKEYPPGSPYDSGFALNVLAFQPTAGLGRETITETVKPSITYKGRPVQVGEVIVGTPEKPRKNETRKDVTE